MLESVGHAKEKAIKALNVSDLSQSDKDKDKRQRFETKRYSPSWTTRRSLNQRKRTIVYSTDSDNDSEVQAPVVKNLKITSRFLKLHLIHISFLI